MELVRDPLLDAVTALASARDVASVCEIVRGAARALTGADGVTFVLREGNHCHYADEDAIEPLWKGRRFPLETCISGWAMLHKTFVVVPDIFVDERIPHDVYRATFVKSLAMVPVRRDDPIGAIGAYWARQHQATADEVGVMQSLADAASLALRNVQLDADLQSALRDERQARSAAEDANRLKDEFLALLSHELRTPLHVIHNWLWQLRQNGDQPASVIAKALDVIERNASLQSRLVDDLLDVSRASAGKLSIDTRLLDLGALCMMAVELSRSFARERGVTVTLVAEPNPTRIWGDLDRIQQVLSNVLTNAIKFSNRGGHVHLKLTRVGSRARIDVTDKGAGVAPEFLPHMFDRFRQADSGMTRRQGGLGLGLTIVREIMALHGGAVSAESAGLGKGTTVHLDFGVAEDPDSADGALSPALSSHGPVH